MDWKLLGIVPPIIFGIAFLASLYGVGVMWKTNNKFFAFLFLAAAAAIGIMFWALYGHDIIG